MTDFIPVQPGTCCACGTTWWWVTTGIRPASCPDCPTDTAAIPAQWQPARMRTALHRIAEAADRGDLPTIRALTAEALR